VIFLNGPSPQLNSGVYNQHAEYRAAIRHRAPTKRGFQNIRKGPMAKFEKHIFICTNQRPEGNPRGCCCPSGEGELQSVFKAKLKQRGIPNSKVRANKAGCLDQCEAGPTVVVYPDAVWYGHVTAADVDEIIDSHILGGKPVERLIIPDDLLNNTQQKTK
jgi:(2Fe-2S) ferredoxin